MKTQTLVSILSVSLASAALAIGCGPTPTPDNYTAAQSLGDYAVAIDNNVVLSASYSVSVAGDGGTGTSATVPYTAITGGSQPTLTDINLSYDGPNHKFVLVLKEGSFTETVEVAETQAVATKTDGSKVAFDPSLQQLKSVELSIQVAPTQVSALATGCSDETVRAITVTLTKDGLTGSVDALESFVNVARDNAAADAGAYVSCQDALAAIEARIRSNQPETSDLPIFVANGALDINHMQDVVSVQSQIRFAGAKSAADAGAATLEIKSGVITGFSVARPSAAK